MSRVTLTDVLSVALSHCMVRRGDVFTLRFLDLDQYGSEDDKCGIEQHQEGVEDDEGPEGAVVVPLAFFFWLCRHLVVD